ncbi:MULTISPECIES: dienelactone hydrolase family protein [Halanaerobium]|uniref:Dienelactone hydrolase n=1 Tax=Halanaerobium kushneri TaxID=56779 RepID=A0A1N6R6Z7_9FIRM|nr:MULTISPECIES: alpha/beta hydrolase family protein [Halanaerobium]RCW61843.1 dienelactone hydrolase [Halanaerobium sp. ST460_2HS_T2]SIQ24603.1 Dienelactone hydrolase [Halanaerobium kushneri]
MAGEKNIFSPDSYLDKLYQKNNPKFHFKAKNIKEWELWRQKLKDKIAEIIGGVPKQTEISEIEVLAENRFKNYRRLRISYQVKNYLQIPAYLLIPEQNKKEYPAVVIAHGHGNGSRETVGLNGAGEDLQESTCHNNLALDFVKAGYIVIIPELIGFGDRRLMDDYNQDPDLKEDPTLNSCYRINSQLLLYGQSILRLRMWDIISAVKLLKKRDDVIKKEINCLGFSGGAPVAILSALFEAEIKSAVISGYTSYYKDSIMDRRHCLDNYLSGILKYAELPTIISALAPKAIMIQAAEKDHLFPIDSAKKAYQEVKKVYQFLDSEEKIEKDILQAGHSVAAAAAIDFFDSLDS